MSAVAENPTSTTIPTAKLPSQWLAPFLAGVAGFVDTTGFIVFAGVFLAHITGNFVVLGATLSGQEHGSAWLKLSVLPLFIAGVALGWLILRHAPLRGSRRIAMAEGLLLLTCGSIGVWSRFVGSFTQATELVAISSGVIAMGLHSMLARSLKLPMTHVMTGNITQLTVEVLDARFNHSDSMSAARRNVTLVLAFASGAVLAGLLVPSVGLAAIIVPALLMFVAASTIT